MTAEETELDALVDRDSLRAFLGERLGDAETLELTLLGGGYSNEVIAVDWGDRELILRRPSPGSEGDLLREYRVLSGLRDTTVPVPDPVAACEDESVIGAEFYLMERLPGSAMGTTELPRIATPKDRREVSELAIDALADIHAVDLAATGLEDFASPQDPARRVAIWDAVYDRLDVAEERERDLEPVLALGEWLREHAPEATRTTLVHGDYRLENVMLAPGPSPRISGILDWENSTLGDPRIDVGYLLATWRDPGDEHDPVVAEWISPFTDRPGYLDRRALVDRYEDAVDQPFTHQRFFRALALYQLAVGGETFHDLYSRGLATEPLFAQMETAVPNLARRGLRIVHGEEPL